MALNQLVLAQIVQIAAIATCVWLVTQTVTRKHAHLSHLLWVVVLLKCVTPPIWSSQVGAFSWLAADRFQVADSIETTSPEVTSIGATELPALPKSVTLPSVEIDLPVADSDVAEVVPLAPEEATPQTFVTTPADESALRDSLLAELNSMPSQPVVTPGYAWILPMLWLGVSAVVMVWTVCRAFVCVRNLKSAEVPNADLQIVVDRLCERLNLKTPVRLLVTSCSVGPAVVGLFRPSIVVPQFIVDRSSPQELESILAHELIHVRRGDLWVGLLRHFVRTLWWFHPFVWKTSSALRRNAERCCDEEVIASLRISASDYARSLLSVLELKQELKAVPIVPGVRPFDITSKRLEKIMQLGQTGRQRTPLWCWGVAIVFAIVSLPGAGLMVGEVTAQGVDDAPNTRLAKGNTTAQQLAFAANSEPLDPPSFVREQDLVQLVFRIATGSQSSVEQLVSWDIFEGGVRRKIVSSREVGRWFDRGKESRQLELVAEPVLTTRPGRPAGVFQGDVKTFVVGVGEGGRPEEKKVNVGTTVKCRPMLWRNAVDLYYEYTTARVAAVDTVDRDYSPTLKIPQVVSASTSGIARIPLGETLVLSYTVDGEHAGGEQKAVVVMVRPELIAAYGPAPPAIAKAEHADPTTPAVAGVTADRKYHSIPWALLQRKPTKQHRLMPEDVIGVYINGIIGGPNAIPPVQLSGSGTPSMGFPIPVRPDGTIPLPMIDDPKVAGLTIAEAEAKIVKAYTVDKNILSADQAVMLSLIRPVHIRVTVFREDAIGRRRTDADRDGTSGYRLDMVANEADVLSALAQTGGLPGLDANQILVYRRTDPSKSMKIPIRLPKGESFSVKNDDVVLFDGDVVVIGPSAPDAPVKPKEDKSVKAAVPLPEADAREASVTVDHPEIGSEPTRWKLTLDECVSMMLQNEQVARTLGVKVLKMTGSNLVTRRIDTSISELDARINLQKSVLEVTRAYWNLHYQYENVSSLKQGLTSAVNTWKRSEKRQELQVSGGEAAFEAQARAQYFSFKSRFEQAKSDLTKEEARLRYMLGLAATDGRVIFPVDQPDSKIAILEHIKYYRNLEVRKQQLKIEHDFMSTRDTKQREILNQQVQTNRREWHQKLAAAVNKRKDTYRILQTQNNTVKAYTDQVQASERAYETAQTIPLDVVLDAQSRLAQAKADLARAATEYQIAIMEERYLGGTLEDGFRFKWLEIGFTDKNIPDLLPGHEFQIQRIAETS